MVVPVAAGPVDVQADWQATPDVWIGRLTSFTALALTAALGLVTGLGGLVRQRSQPQLK
jgi:hypothetical protein